MTPEQFQEKIDELSGVSREEAFSIDKVNLFKRLGEDLIFTVSRRFYDRAFDDEEALWFKNIFKNLDKENAIRNLSYFLIQRFGGPPMFTEKRGHPALMARHRGFNMSQKATERWLYHMENVLNESPELDEDSRERMLKFFRHTGFFLSLGLSRPKS